MYVIARPYGMAFRGSRLYVCDTGGRRGVIFDFAEPGFHTFGDSGSLRLRGPVNINIAPDGTKNRPVTYFGGVQRYGRFSPDGRWIVFCQGPSERGPWQLYRIPAQGGTPIRITEEGSDMYPDWK